MDPNPGTPTDLKAAWSKLCDLLPMHLCKEPFEEALCNELRRTLKLPQTAAAIRTHSTFPGPKWRSAWGERVVEQSPVLTSQIDLAEAGIYASFLRTLLERADDDACGARQMLGQHLAMYINRTMRSMLLCGDPEKGKYLVDRLMRGILNLDVPHAMCGYNENLYKLESTVRAGEWFKACLAQQRLFPAEYWDSPVWLASRNVARNANLRDRYPFLPAHNALPPVQVVLPPNQLLYFYPGAMDVGVEVTHVLPILVTREDVISVRLDVQLWTVIRPTRIFNLEFHGIPEEGQSA